MKSIFFALIFLVSVFLFNPLSAKEASIKREAAENLFKSMPAHEQKMVRIIASTKSIYIAAQDYSTLNTAIMKRAYPDNSQNGREGILTDIQTGDFEGVEIFVSPEDPKVAVFTLKSNSCPVGLQSMQNNFIKLNVVPNISNIQCSPDGYVIKSYPLDK